MNRIFGFDSFEFTTDEVDLNITKEGAQMAPVTFFPRSGSPVSPYYINPWCEEKKDHSLPVLLQALRGDFFCLPFGGDNVTAAFSYDCHGPTANGEWRQVHRDARSLTIAMDFPDGKAHVQSRYATKQGHSAIYITNTVSGCNLRLPYGHHCILDCSAYLLLSTSPAKFGIVTQESDTPAFDGEYRALVGHGVFESMKQAPSRFTDYPSFDLTEFPSREGFCDIVQMVNDPQAGEIGWSCAVCPDKGYLWYSIKKISDFPTTLFWMENKGRHGKPWSGRNVCIGIEDAMSCFAAGAAVSSVDNELSQRGIQTARKFSEAKPVTVKIIEGVARIPSGFTRVKQVRFNIAENTAMFIDENGTDVLADIDSGFLD